MFLHARNVHRIMHFSPHSVGIMRGTPAQEDNYSIFSLTIPMQDYLNIISGQFAHIFTYQENCNDRKIIAIFSGPVMLSFFA